MRAPAFWTIREGRDAAPMLRLLLSPLGWLYGASVANRFARTSPLRLPIKVISIGNLTAGGTGKTPLAAMLRDEVSKMVGAATPILMRGYGGRIEGPLRVDPHNGVAREVGDEALMLAQSGLVWVSKDRAAGGVEIVKTQARAVILDDAHQNPALAKDLSVVVVDGQTGFGNGHLIPAGPLREPVIKGLARADLVITMGPVSEDTEDDLADYQGPRLAADLVPKALENVTRAIGFCGIGRPEKFEDTMRQTGLEVVNLYPFADHHFYTDGELSRLARIAKEADATLVTTQKDYVRLPADFARHVRVIPITAVMQEPHKLHAILAKALDVALPQG